MKQYCKRILFLGILIAALLFVPLSAYGADPEIEYDNYIAITLAPDGSIFMTLKGNQSYINSSLQSQSDIQNLDMTIDINVEDEDLTSFDGDIKIQFDPSVYSHLANLDLSLTAHSDETITNLTAKVEYPGYLGLDGRLGVAIVEPPFGIIMDLMLEAKLYYTIYSKEELQILTSMIPMLETQLSSIIMESTDGNIIMEKFELLEFEEGLEYATFTIYLRLSGDIEEGLSSTFEEYKAEITLPEVSDELTALSIKSIDYYITFSGDKLLLETDFEGSIEGDFNKNLNKVKDSALKEALESDEIDSEERTLIQSAQPINLNVQHLVIEFINTYEDGSVESNLSVDSIGLEPTSFEILLVFLEELSKTGDFEDLKLVFEGVTSNDQYVSINVPTQTKVPILQKEQLVVWEIENIENLDEITYEVKTKAIQTTTIILGSVIGLVLLGVAAYVLKNR